MLEHLSKRQLIAIIHDLRKINNKGNDAEEPKENLAIPLEIFIRPLAPLEAVCKYLREKGLTYAEIAHQTRRDTRTIWSTYRRAQGKIKKKFLIKRTTIYIPIEVIKNRKLSVLEGIAMYLKEHRGLTLHQIAILLHRDDRTIWTVYARSQRKGGPCI